MYCGPTSSTDLLQWLHDHGFPLVDAPEDLDLGCSSSDLSDAVTEFIADLGDEMDTDLNGGTGSETIVRVLQRRLDIAYPGSFTVGFNGRVAESRVRDYGRDFSIVVRHLHNGRLALVNVGWYVIGAVGSIPEGKRCGGHWVAITGYNERPDDGAYEARYVDPGRECLTISTKEVTREVLTLEDPDDAYRVHTVSSWNWTRDGNASSDYQQRMGIQDNVVSIAEACLFSLPNGLIECLNMATGVRHTVKLLDEPRFPIPDLWLLGVYYIGDDNGIHHLDFTSRESAKIPIEPELKDVQEFALADEGTMFVLDAPPQQNPIAYAIDPSGKVLAEESLPGAGSLAYHEVSDQLLLWNVPKGELYALDTRLVPVQKASYPLPDAVNAEAPFLLAPDPTSDLVYYSHGRSTQIYCLDLKTGEARAPLEMPDRRKPARIVFDNLGRLYVSSTQEGPVVTFLDGKLEGKHPAHELMTSGFIAVARAGRRPLIEKFTEDELNIDVPSDADEPRMFLRGDCNADGNPDISDGIFNLQYLFTGGQQPPCKEACDSNGDRVNDLSDAVYLFGYLFLGSPPPPAPFPSCGEVRQDNLSVGCDRSTCPVHR